MDQEFIDIIIKMTKEQGAAVLVDGTWKKWLADYTGPWYPKETKFLKQILNANCAEYINSATDVPERKQALLVQLEDDEGLSPKITAEYLDLLGLLLKGDTSKCGTPMPQIPPIPAAPVPVAPAGMVPIAGGTFMMGSPASEPYQPPDQTQHQVTLSGFYIRKYPVTQQEYEELTGINPSGFKGDTLPVENVSWFDAVEYCNRLSRREGLNPAYTIHKDISDPNNTDDDYEMKWQVNWNRSANGYRLPTEAEWEYACRAGTTTPYSSGSTVDKAGWYRGNSGDKTHPVGEKQANAWGLYDMHGNVGEWCWDWYLYLHGSPYPDDAQTDPVGASFGDKRVCRGGNFASSPDYLLRSAERHVCTPSERDIVTGFRLVRSFL